MRVMLQFMYAARLYSVAALMEHPAFPHWVPAHKKPASSSLLPELQDLLKYPEVDEVTFDQGTLQAKSVKPTTFHLVNFPQMKSALVDRTNASRCTSAQAKRLEKLRGQDANGRFKTAPSKQYPPDMCGLMAKATGAYLQGIIPGKRGKMPCWEEIVVTKAFDFFVPLDPYLEAHAWGQFGADCATGSHRGAIQPLSGHQRVDADEEGADSVELNAENPSAFSFDFADPIVPIGILLPEPQSIVPLAAQSTPAQILRTANNRIAAIAKKRAKSLTMVSSQPSVEHIAARESRHSVDLNAENLSPAVSSAPLASLITHRPLLAFGVVTPSQARIRYSLKESVSASATESLARIHCSLMDVVSASATECHARSHCEFAPNDSVRVGVTGASSVAGP